MKYLLIIVQIFVLYAFCWSGTVLVNWLHIPLPGSIIGLLLLLGCLLSGIMPAKFVKEGAGFLLPILTLLFIPATVGIMNYPQLLSSYGIVLVIIVTVSTLITFILTGKLARRMEGKAYDRN